MRRIAVPLALVLAVSAIAADEKKPVTVFDPLKVWEVQVTLTVKEFDAMQPPAGGGFPGFGQPPAPPKPREDGREVHPNTFGTELPWAKGSVTVDGKTFDNVGIRYKGNGTILETNGKLKKSIKVDLDKHGGKERFHGLKTINLHCGIADPSKCRETLTYQIFRDAGVPAPKTALAVVTLTVTGGKYDKERLGLYTLVQPVDKVFLKEHYKSDAGLLFKPERIQGLDYLGDDWAKYIPTYDPSREAKPDEQKRLMAFTKLVNQADDKAFNKEIADYLDIDSYLRFQAASAVVVNMDSFFTLGHNYCLYLHPDTNKFHFIPWDVDRALANFPAFGTNDQKMDLSLTKPYAACKLADRVMAAPGVADKYKDVLKDVCAKGFDKESVLKSLKAVEEVVKPHIEKDTKAASARREFGGGFNFGVPPELKTFVEKRAASIADQLAGKSKGYVPQQFGFGPPPGGGGGGGGFGGFGPGNQLARPLVEKLDANKDGKVSDEEFAAGMKKLFAEWDADKSGSVEQKEIADGLQKLLPPPGPPGGGFGPPGGGFGPGGR